MRLVVDQSGQIERAPAVTFIFDGAAVQGHPGEPLIAALLRSGLVHLRAAPNDAAPRGAFCCMGLCQECAVRIDGKQVEACRIEVCAGLSVERAG